MIEPWKSALTSLACIPAAWGIAALASPSALSPSGSGGVPSPSSSDMYPSHNRWSGTNKSHLKKQKQNNQKHQTKNGGTLNPSLARAQATHLASSLRRRHRPFSAASLRPIASLFVPSSSGFGRWRGDESRRAWLFTARTSCRRRTRSLYSTCARARDLSVGSESCVWTNSGVKGWWCALVDFTFWQKRGTV